MLRAIRKRKYAEFELTAKIHGAEIRGRQEESSDAQFDEKTNELARKAMLDAIERKKNGK